MSEKSKKNNIIIVAIILVIISSGIASVIYINKEKNKSKEIEATVKLIGDDYIIVENDEGEEFSLSIKGEYNIGDRVNFVIKNIKKDTKPKQGTVVKIDTISEYVEGTITDNNNENNNEENNIVEDNNIEDKQTENKNIEKQESTNTSTNSNSTTNKTSVESNSTEEDVITYFNNLNNKLDTYKNDKTIGESLKQGFITVVDFLFYNGQIKGKTFDELSNTTKIKVLQIALSIDKKIDKYFPGYKETISTTSSKVYTKVKSKVIELYLDITTKVCQDNSDTCETAKEGLSDLKTSFGVTWDFIKDITGIGLNKLKAWYEIWKKC